MTKFSKGYLIGGCITAMMVATGIKWWMAGLVVVIGALTQAVFLPREVEY